MTESPEVKETTESGTKQVALVVGQDGRGLMPTTLDEMWRMANLMAKSGMMPKGLQQPEQVLVALEMGLEIGLAPMQAVQNIAVINGRPSIWGDAALGLVRGSGLLEWINESFVGDYPDASFMAICKAKRKGEPEPIERTFSINDAKAAGLWAKEGPWKQYPKRMLQMRARSWALRDGFTDILKGLKTAEEVRDTPIDLDNYGSVYEVPKQESAQDNWEQPLGELVAALTEPEDDLGTKAKCKKELLPFIEESAKTFGATKEAIIKAALNDVDTFYDAFQKWEAKQQSKAKTKTAPKLEKEAAPKQAPPETEPPEQEKPDPVAAIIARMEELKISDFEIDVARDKLPQATEKELTAILKGLEGLKPDMTAFARLVDRLDSNQGSLDL